MKHIIILLTAFFIANSQIIEQHKFVLVQITDSDLEQFGPWPMDRKWFAILIEEAIMQNSPAIFIDIAFPKADEFHPQSDQFFYHTVTTNPVYLRSQENDLMDSIPFLGNYQLVSNQTWGSISDQYQFDSDFIQFNNVSNRTILAKLQLDTKPEHFINYPKSELPFYSFSEILKDSKPLKDKIVILGLDAKGLSSYIQIPTQSKLITTSEIEFYSLIQITTGQSLFYFNQWLLSLLLIPFGIWLFLVRNKKYNLQITIISAVLTSLIILICTIFSIYISIYIIAAFALMILISLIYTIYERVIQNKINLRLLQESSGPQHGLIHAEIERLKEQLRFYEEKTDRTMKSELVEENGILYTANSPMKKLMHRANEVAQTDLNVLITGPTGTGKELLAKHIHLKSNRFDQPFVAVHCGALTETLIESELFGHEKGAFTGANQEKEGRFKLADGGTIFLDEIAETSPAFQVKLLRVIQEGSYERVGGNKTLHVNVRVIAATHQDIKELIKTNQFRDDLYYRLAGYEIQLPPLSKRPMDIQPIFLSILNQIEGNKEVQLSEALFRWLNQQKWNGNIRQLKMLTERAVVNARSNNRNQLVPADFEIGEIYKSNDTDQTAELVLEQLRKHQFKHRAISLTAHDLNLHRITVTEYLRGTIIRQFIRSNYSKENLLKYIADESIIDNYHQFEKRIIGYLETMTSHIKNAISEQLKNEEIRQRYFTNLPTVFAEDLVQLIDYTKKVRY